MRDWFNSHLVRKNRFALDSEIIQYTKRKSIFAFGAELVRFTKKKTRFAFDSKNQFAFDSEFIRFGKRNSNHIWLKMIRFIFFKKKPIRIWFGIISIWKKDNQFAFIFFYKSTIVSSLKSPAVGKNRFVFDSELFRFEKKIINSHLYFFIKAQLSVVWRVQQLKKNRFAFDSELIRFGKR